MTRCLTSVTGYIEEFRDRLLSELPTVVDEGIGVTLHRIQNYGFLRVEVPSLRSDQCRSRISIDRGKE